MAERKDRPAVQPEQDANVFRLQIRTGQDGNILGTVYWDYGKRTAYFTGLDQAVLLIQEWMDQLEKPDEKAKLRTFSSVKRPARSAGANPPAAVLKEKASRGAGKNFPEVFLVRVYFRQHTSWQGEVRWKGRQSFYRSGMELLSLIRSALNGPGVTDNICFETL